MAKSGDGGGGGDSADARGSKRPKGKPKASGLAAIISAQNKAGEVMTNKEKLQRWERRSACHCLTALQSLWRIPMENPYSSCKLITRVSVADASLREPSAPIRPPRSD